MIDYDRVSLIDTFKTFTRLSHKQVMLLERGRIIDLIGTHYFLMMMMRKMTLFMSLACNFVESSTSKFYSLCKVTGNAKFAILKRMAGV